MNFNLKKSITMALAAGVTALSLAMPVSYAAAGDDAAAPATGETASAEQNLTPEEALDYFKNSGYTYTSKRYGYSIVCPVKPNVVPLSTVYDDEKISGDVLIFANDGYNIVNAWVVMIDAFDEKTIPKDLNKKSEQEQKAFLDKYMESQPVEFAKVAEVAGGVGIYSVTAKVYDIDTNGDGKPDETVTADTQMVNTYFRGQYGGRFLVGLMDNPELTKQNVALYELGLLTFQEWPSAMDEHGKTKDKEKKK